jgi:hypothetical protein
MLGFKYDDIVHMIESINIAYEIIDVSPSVDDGLKKSISLLTGLVTEGHIQ